MQTALQKEIIKLKRYEVQFHKLSYIMEHIPVSVIVTDIKGNIEYVNQKFAKLTGYTIEEAIGKNPNILKSGKTTLGDYKDLWESVTSGREWYGELCNKKKNGELYWESAYILPIINTEGVITNFVAVKEDITERKSIENTLRESEKKLKTLNERLEQRVEERTKKIYKENATRNKIEIALRESEKKFQDLYENLPDMYLSVDVKTSKIIQCNKTFAKKLGYKKEEIVDKVMFSLYHPDCIEEARQVFQKFINTGEVNNAELQMKRKDDSKMEVLLNATAFRNKDGKILYSRSIYRDITERKSLQEALVDQKSALEKKNIALGEILGQLEIEKKQIKDNVVANAENLLLPIIQKLKLTGEAAEFVQLLQKNLEELVSSFGSRLIGNTAKLTTREIEICNMVKNGLTNKEIARLLAITLGTTKRHRNNIRRKIGIINTDMNLASFLNGK